MPAITTLFRTLPAAVCLALAGSASAQNGRPAPIQSSTKVFADNSVSTTVVNPDAGIAEETLRDAAGKTLRRTVYSLDARGQYTGATFYDAKNQIRYRETYLRDSYNRVVESRLFSASDAPLGRRVFHFDSKGRVTVEDYDAADRLIAPAKKPGKKP